MTTTEFTPVIQVREGFGPTRKTRKSAQREADAWTASGDGRPYSGSRIDTEVRVVEGGFVCVYVTTRQVCNDCGGDVIGAFLETNNYVRCRRCGHVFPTAEV